MCRANPGAWQALALSLKLCGCVRQDAGLQLTQAAQLAQEFSVDARRSAPAPDGSSAPLLRLTVRWARLLFSSHQCSLAEDRAQPVTRCSLHASTLQQALMPAGSLSCCAMLSGAIVCCECHDIVALTHAAKLV